MGAFAFSEEDGTPAAELPEQVSVPKRVCRVRGSTPAAELPECSGVRAHVCACVSTCVCERVCMCAGVCNGQAHWLAQMETKALVCLSSQWRGGVQHARVLAHARSMHAPCCVRPQVAQPV